MGWAGGSVGEFGGCGVKGIERLRHRHSRKFHGPLADVLLRAWL